MANGKNGNGLGIDVQGGPEVPGLAPVQLAIGPVEGRVVMVFQRPMAKIEMDPVNAALIGKNLIDQAVALGARVEIQLQKRTVITKEKFEALVARTQHIIRSLEEKHRRPEHIAREVVEQILAATD